MITSSLSIVSGQTDLLQNMISLAIVGVLFGQTEVTTFSLQAKPLYLQVKSFFDYHSYLDEIVELAALDRACNRL